jgi:hypothetical protein
LTQGIVEKVPYDVTGAVCIEEEEGNPGCRR